MKLGAFVLTFRRPEILQDSLERLLQQTRPPDLVLVVDNGGDRETEEVVRSFDGRVAHEVTGDNLGSAGGTAYGTSRLLEMGFDLIYSGDDDNPPRTKDTVERLLALLAQAGPEVGGVGTVGARWSWETGSLQRLPDEILQGPVEVDFIGGDHKLILTRKAVERVGPPNAHLFFGYPDLEHCLRLRRAGFRLLVDGELMYQYRQRVGHLGKTRRSSLLPGRSRADLWRSYYTTRNYIHMMRSTFGRPALARRYTAKTLAKMATGWFRGLGYGAAFTRLQVAAILDAYAGRLGRTVPPEPKY